VIDEEKPGEVNYEEIVERKLRNLTGVHLQTSGLPDSMCVDETMRLFATHHGVAPPYHLLERLGMSEKMSAQYHTLSRGKAPNHSIMANSTNVHYV